MEIVSILFAPAIAYSIWYRRKAVKDASTIDRIFHYIEWAGFILLITVLTITYIFGIDGVTAEAFSSFPFFIKYNAIAVFYSLLLPFVVEIITKWFGINVNITVSDEKSDKKN